MVVGKNIIYLRRVHNLTQDDLATKISVSRQTISKWENGEVVPDSLNLIELSKEFNVKVDDLLMTELENIIIPVKIEEAKSDQPIIKPKSKLYGVVTIGVVLFLIVVAVYMNRDNFFSTNKNNEIDEDVPEEVVSVDYSKLLSAGREFSVFIDENGSVIGYGDNTYNQIDFDNWSDIIQVSAGGFHTLGLKSDGSVLAVGYNNLGQTNVSSWSNIVQVSGGRYHSLGLKDDGTVVCVGENEYGACDVSGWSDITQVSAGRYNSYGIKSDGTVVSTKDNQYGQANITSWSDIKQISSGTYQVLGLKSDGTVLCAGGQSGDGVCNVSSWADIKQVVGAGYHSIGLKNDGSVVAVGNNEKGQLNVSDWKDIVAISGGRNHTIGLTKENQFLSLGLDGNKNVTNLGKDDNNQEDSDNENQEGKIKYRLIGSDSYANILINSKGNSISNINYLEEQYRIEFKSKAKNILLKITTIEGIEYITFFNFSNDESGIKFIDIYEELLKVLYADQNTHKDQILKISLSERIDDSNISEYTNWKDLTYKFDAREEFSQLFARHGQIELDKYGNMTALYPGRLDISQFKSGADLDLYDGFDFVIRGRQLSDGLNLETVLSSVYDDSSPYSTVPDNFELGKTFYLCNSVPSTDGTGSLMYSGDKLITNCSPFSLNSIRFGLTHYNNASNYGEMNFFYARVWMKSKADNNFEIEIIAKDIKYVNVFDKSLSLTSKGFIVNVINEMKKDFIVDETTPETFEVNVSVTAKGVGNYLESLPFEFKIILKKSDFE